jgi:putative N-acetylmannosamine-6-phosphate epimerase
MTTVEAKTGIRAGDLIVSCQADPESPLAAPEFIRALALAAVQGGARGLRLEGTANIRAVREVTELPIIGLVKRQGAFRHVYITPEPADIAAVAEAGANIVAFDATLRERPASVADLVREAHAHGLVALADVATVADAEHAIKAGADLISTTLSGYTASSPRQEGPDFELIKDLVARGVRPLAEGRLRTPAEAAEALRCGALAVVVGGAITRPELLTARFAEALGVDSLHER